jgi:DnaJ-class molecular chaperone
VKVPEGAQNGSVLKIKGKGMPMYNEPGKYGDLFLEILVEIPQRLNAEQKEMFMKLKGSFVKRS